MDRALAVVGALSSLGTRPYDDGVARYVDRAPEVFRERGLVERLRAADLGDVVAPPYRDYVKPERGARNETEVVAYSRRLAERVAIASAHRRFVLVIGGDCSVVLGCVLGARHLAGAPTGLVYFDAHADFATTEESMSGSVASMALRLATGRGESALARLAGDVPLVDDRHVALVGRRDSGRASRGHAALAASGILDVPDTELLTREPSDVAAEVLTRVVPENGAGFWIHVDADVINPTAVAAVESPEPGGPMPAELSRLLMPLVHHPQVLGLSLTVYDPALDPDRSGARQLIHLLDALFRSSGRAGR